jgi:hypothetical protein
MGQTQKNELLPQSKSTVIVHNHHQKSRSKVIVKSQSHRQKSKSSSKVIVKSQSHRQKSRSKVKVKVKSQSHRQKSRSKVKVIVKSQKPTSALPALPSCYIPS